MKKDMTTIVLKLNGEEREVSVEQGQFGGEQDYLKLNNVAIKTSSGGKLHCGSIFVQPITYKVLHVSYHGALGNGSGLGSRFSFFDFADKYSRDQFSKATQPAFDTFQYLAKGE